MYRFSSNWGPRVRWGEFKEPDTLYLTVPAGTLLSTVTRDDAIKLFPSNVGTYLRHPIMLHHGSGRSKFYIKHGGQNYPLHWDYKKKEKKEITKQDCVKSIKSYKEYQKKIGDNKDTKPEKKSKQNKESKPKKKITKPKKKTRTTKNKKK